MKRDETFQNMNSNLKTKRLSMSDFLIPFRDLKMFRSSKTENAEKQNVCICNFSKANLKSNLKKQKTKERKKIYRDKFLRLKRRRTHFYASEILAVFFYFKLRLPNAGSMIALIRLEMTLKTSSKLANSLR